MQLVVIAGPDKGQSFPLPDKDLLIVGRSRANDVRLTDPYVSRVHVQLELKDGAVKVIDFDSAGGTYVNEERILQRPLYLKDVLRIGHTQLQLVSGCDDPSTIVQSDPRATPALSTPQQDLVQLVGTKISHYVIGQVLAQGKHGLVFHARDEQNDRPIAMKVLFPRVTADEEARQRFVRAMKTVLPLRHPNLVALYGAGKTGDFCWIAMEFVEGESLTQVVQRIGTIGMLDWRHAVRVGVCIGRALEYAHGHRILHRNVTPMNILVRPGCKSAKLGDLMLAKALEGDLAGDVTRVGEIIGDVAYLAPERTYGAATVDERSDLYSLGATIYAMLTGRPPCEGGVLEETIQLIRHAPPQPPKKFQLAVPDRLQDAVLQLLAKRPEDRYATATAVVRELERIAAFAGLTL